MNKEELIYRTASEHSAALSKGEYSARDLAEACLKRADDTQNLGIFLELNAESVMAQAKESDERRAKKQTKGALDGIPVALKDNICVKDQLTTCASKILENFRAPYDAHIVEKLKGGGAVLFGRTNMDEFAMGSSTENSAYQITRNPWNPEKVPGGSSGGSAAAVAASVVPLSIGSDTGGSIRQPAALCGVYGLKPTYGLVSRYGLVAFASSLDQIGPFAKSTDDLALLLNGIGGHDRRDSTSKPIDKLSLKVPGDGKPFMKGMKIGVSVPSHGSAGFDEDVITACETVIKNLKAAGAEVIPVQSKLWDYAIDVYYILATAEASSNLSRYDGVRYGHRAKEPHDLLDLYVRSRTEGFGPEVKRRILLGTYVLSSGYFDAYYRSAEKARIMIKKEYDAFFQKVDLILQPTSPTTAFGLGEKLKNPIAMYQSDLLTIAVNLGGVPSMSVPVGRDRNGLPIGVQITGAPMSEEKMFSMSSYLSSIPGFVPEYRDVNVNRGRETLEKSSDYSKKNSRHNIPVLSQETQNTEVKLPEKRVHSANLPGSSEKKTAATAKKAEAAGAGKKAGKAGSTGNGTKGRGKTADSPKGTAGAQGRRLSEKKGGAARSATPVKKQPKEGVNPMMKKKTAKKKTAKKKTAKKKTAKKRR
ncbi:MAG: Asp-tRNA(Asn)/Glu-tRNA(Gln) amidotransferase subunit GatA [Spirochaetia bacterium]|nr:Asp-tRNA(Asn)/Glu-tRNA(Gln) amidotransferase subunit GatA [Spirochaetia bacterium]